MRTNVQKHNFKINVLKALGKNLILNRGQFNITKTKTKEVLV